MTSTYQLMRAVFLDRDGVLNRAIIRNGKPYPPASVAEFEIMSDARGSLETLKGQGFLLVVVSNQPDVARGTQLRETVEQMNQILASSLPVDDVLVCYHTDEDHCECRKPLPGLLVEAARKHSIDLHRSFMVGDRWRDIEAGESAGCQTILIDNSYDEKAATRGPDARVRTLADASRWILLHSGE